MNQAIRFLKTPATLIGLLLLLIGAGAWSVHAINAPVTDPVDNCVMTDVGNQLTPRFVSVRILNAGAAGGMAKGASNYLRSYGFNVIRVNNADHPLQKTTIIGFAADSPEVKLLQQAYPYAAVEGDGRADHVVDVLLGPDASKTPPQPSSIPVTGQVCLARYVLQSPSANPTQNP